MIRPINQTTGQIDYTDNGKTALLSTTRGNRIVSFIKGEVVESNSSKCGGFVKIKHNVCDKIFYSEYCGIESIQIFTGDNLKLGETIGISGGQDITFSIIDDNKRKKDIESILNYQCDENEKGKKSEIIPLNSKETKEPKNVKIPKEPKTNNVTYDETPKMKYSEKEVASDIYDTLFGAAFSPMSVIHGGLTKSSTRRSVREEVERIKNLMK